MLIKPSRFRLIYITVAMLTITLIHPASYNPLRADAGVQSDSRDMRTRPSQSIDQWPASTKRFALIIGVDEYQDKQINRLLGASNDAKALSEALVRYAGFPRNQVILLASDQPVDHQPTRSNIMRQLLNLRQVAPKDGLLLISFSGHGFERDGRAYLLPMDAQASEDTTLLEESAINAETMRERIRQTGVGQVIIILDACRNNPASGKGEMSAPLTDAYVRGFNFDLRNREIVAFATIYATGVGQLAYEDKDRKQGYFTLAMEEGLKGAAANERGEVTLAGLVAFVQETVPKRTALGVGIQQKPFAVVDGYKANDLIISVPKLASSATSNSQAGNVAADPSPKLDLPTALALLDRAIKAKDGSKQGQVAAIEDLLKRGFSYKNTSFDGVSLAGAMMPGADFSSSSFVDGDLSNTEFEGGKLDGANLNFANLQNASLRNVNAEETYFQYAQADSAHFDNAKLNRSSFFLSRLPGASFKNAKLRGACLAFCDLTGADFTGADLTDAIIFSSVVDKAIFKDAIINNTDVGASVANNISFTPEQRNELRRSSPLVRYLDIQIWGHARHTNQWNASYPDFSSYYTKLVKIPETLSGSLKFRNENAMQPVGPFRTYRRRGPNDIRSSYWFDVEFWEQSDRSQRLKKRLKDYGEFLFEQISAQASIEGSGQELKTWMSFIEKNSQATACSGPLIWTNDAYMTLLLSKGMISPNDINESDWKSLAVGRCQQDAKYSADLHRDSWKPMYPPGAMCEMLPPSHVDAYKKWTIARSKNPGFQQIEAVYRVSVAALNRAKRITGEGTSSKEQILIFDELKDTYQHLDDSMVSSSWKRQANEEFLLGLPAKVSKGPAWLKLPAARARYSVVMSPDQLAFPKPENNSQDTFFQFRVVFDLSEVSLKDGSIYELTVIPKNAKIEVEGNKIWEGAIVLLNDKK